MPVTTTREISNPSLITRDVIDADQLRRICLDVGADDVGFVELDRRELADQKEDILRVFPRAKTLISIVLRMNREPIRSPARSVANRCMRAVSIAPQSRCADPAQPLPVPSAVRTVSS